MPVANRFGKILIVCGVFLFIGQIPAPAQASYEVQGLGFIGGLHGAQSSSNALCVNAVGQVVGRGDGIPYQRAFLWDSTGGMKDLGELTGSAFSGTAEAINDQGQVVGGTYSTAGGQQAYFWSAGTGLIILESLAGSCEAHGINNSGQVAGYCTGAFGMQAFVWSLASGAQILGDLPGGNRQYIATAINDAGMVAGRGYTYSTLRPFVWDQANGIRVLQVPPGSGDCSAFSINNENPPKVVGYCSAGLAAVSYVWNAATGQVVDTLGQLPGGSVRTYAKGINDPGQIVGYAETATNTRWPIVTVAGDSAVLVNLQEVTTTPGWTLIEVNGINSSGKIVGRGEDPSGLYQAFILNPANGEICTDQIDNDGDGLADCGDPDCAQHIDCVTCYSNSDCTWPSSGKYCQKPAYSCSGPGRCVAPPPVGGWCAQVMVCGCDGTIFGNPCDAARAGVNAGPYDACCTDNDGDGYPTPVSLCAIAKDCNDCNSKVDDVPAHIVLSQDQFAFQGVQAGPAPTTQPLTVTNPGCGAFSWSASADAPWLTLSPSAGAKGGSTAIGVNTAVLPAGVSSATVTIKDPANATLANATAAVSITVTADTTPPSGALLINSGATYTAAKVVTLNLTAADSGGSGLDAMRFVNGGGTATAWEPFQPAKAWTLPGAAGAKTVFVQFRDKAANISDADPVKAGPQSYKDEILYDPVAPTGSLTIDDGAATTASRDVTLGLAAADTGGSGLDAMRFANGGGATSAWEPCAATKAWTLSGGAGTKIIYVQFKDKAGNVSDADPAKAGVQSYKSAISYTGP